MCGIAGILSPQPPPESVEAVARRMGGALRHRGPDGFRTWSDPTGRIGLAHARLSVIDLEGGAQPMGDQGLRLVLNGEIYNYRELRSRLEGHGHSFRTRSDTEVLLEGYRRWGTDVVDHLDGMFAFALWDRSRGRLVLARDPAGKKPLYWSADRESFRFASEIKGILAGGPTPHLCPSAVPEYLTFGYVPSPHTFYQGVEQLPPGCIAEVGLDLEPRVRTFWVPRFRGEPMSTSEAVEGIRTRLEAAVRKRLVSDVPVGAFLSGGIDSTVVVGLMSRLTSQPVRTFSIGFADDPTYDETGYARVAAEAFGTDHTEFVVEAESVELLDDLVRAHDQPFGDSSAIPTYIVSRLTRSEVTVALTGDGGDELFAGYLRLFWAGVAGKIPAMAVRAGQGVLGLFPDGRDPRSLRRRAGRFLDACSVPLDERMLRWIGFFARDLDRWVRPEILAAGGRERMESFRRPLRRADGGSPLDRALQLNFETYLCDDLLVKADRCSMAHGLELRSPFLDRELVSFASRLPDRLRAPAGQLKWVLKRAFRDLVPPEILGRRKMGFGVPLPTWFRGRWRPLLEQRILGSDSALWDFMNPDPVRALALDHIEGRGDHGHRLWALVTLERWLTLQPAASTPPPAAVEGPPPNHDNSPVNC